MTMPRIDQTSILHQRAIGRFQEANGRDRPGTAADGTDNPSGATAPVRTEDRAEISDMARRLMELQGAVDVGRVAIAAAPDVRADRVEEARQRLERGFYNSTEVRDKVADGVAGVVDGMEEL